VKVAVDRSRCTGHGRCYALAPEVYEPDDEGNGVVRRTPVPPELRDAARRGALNCPEDAIQVFEDDPEARP